MQLNLQNQNALKNLLENRPNIIMHSIDNSVQLHSKVMNDTICDSEETETTELPKMLTRNFEPNRQKRNLLKGGYISHKFWKYNFNTIFVN